MKLLFTIISLLSVVMVFQVKNLEAQNNQTYKFNENISYRTSEEEKQNEYIAFLGSTKPGILWFGRINFE